MADTADLRSGRDHSATGRNAVYSGRRTTRRLLPDLLRTSRSDFVSDNIFSVATLCRHAASLRAVTGSGESRHIFPPTGPDAFYLGLKFVAAKRPISSSNLKFVEVDRPHLVLGEERQVRRWEFNSKKKSNGLWLHYSVDQYSHAIHDAPHRGDI